DPRRAPAGNAGGRGAGDGRPPGPNRARRCARPRGDGAGPAAGDAGRVGRRRRLGLRGGPAPLLPPQHGPQPPGPPRGALGALPGRSPGPGRAVDGGRGRAAAGRRRPLTRRHRPACAHAQPAARNGYWGAPSRYRTAASPISAQLGSECPPASGLVSGWWATITAAAGAFDELGVEAGALPAKAAVPARPAVRPRANTPATALRPKIQRLK